MLEISVGKPCALIEQADDWKEIGQSLKNRRTQERRRGRGRKIAHMYVLWGRHSAKHLILAYFCFSATLLGKYWYPHSTDEKTSLEFSSPCKSHGKVRINTQVHLTPCVVISLLHHTAFTGSIIIITTLRDISPLLLLPRVRGVVKIWGPRVRPKFSSTLTAYFLCLPPVPSSLITDFCTCGMEPAPRGLLWRVNGVMDRESGR